MCAGAPQAASAAQRIGTMRAVRGRAAAGVTCPHRPRFAYPCTRLLTSAGLEHVQSGLQEQNFLARDRSINDLIRQAMCSRRDIVTLGYDKPLYLLPFDHRHSYVTDMFEYKGALTAPERAAIVDSKRVIYEGFVQAVNTDVPKEFAGILVDEEFGADVLRDAKAGGYLTALSVEKSGSDEFEFEYGDAFGQHIEAFGPTFAKVLVRFNPEDDAALNLRQAERLKRLSDFCAKSDQKLMFELLVPATKGQLERVKQDKDAYDRQVRPGLMVQAMRDLQDTGVEPDIWKVEGLGTREDCERVVETARSDGRKAVSCIVLGRGADEKRVTQWLELAASVTGFIGFAVGRTSFWDAVADYEAKKIDRLEAASRIAQRYSEWTAIFLGTSHATNV